MRVNLPIKLLLFLVFLGGSGVVYWQSLGLRSARLSNGARFELVDCWFKNDSAIRVECGYMTTRIDAVNNASFKLPIIVLRHSLWKNSEAPMLHIAGGPGGPAYIDARSMPYWLQDFQMQEWGVDFVLYDQRGAGLSQPFLDCPNSEKERLASLKLPLTASEDGAAFIKQMQQCHRLLSEQQNIRGHLNNISTQHSADDIADLQALLGIKQWVLMGVSYGTRLALEFSTRYPDKVQSMVLDSVYPPEFNGFETMVENGFKGVERLLEACENDRVCDKQFPDLSEQLRQALFKLVDSPLLLSVKRHDDAQPHKPILLTAHRLILLLDYASYDSRLLKVVPAAIAGAFNQDVQNSSLLKLASNYLEIELFEQFSEPVYMLTECRENGRFDMTALLARLRPYIQEYPMLDWSTGGIFDPTVCNDWFEQPVHGEKPKRRVSASDKPTLILGGSLDSITPPEWGKYAAKALPNSRYLEYPNAGHSVLASSLCANDEVQVFLNPDHNKTVFCSISERAQDLGGKSMNWTMH